MKIKCLQTECNGPNATVQMESGDNLSIAFVDLSGQARIVNITVQGKVMLVTDAKTDSSLLVRSKSVYFQYGEGYQTGE